MNLTRSQFSLIAGAAGNRRHAEELRTVKSVTAMNLLNADIMHWRITSTGDIGPGGSPLGAPLICGGLLDFIIEGTGIGTGCIRKRRKIL